LVVRNRKFVAIRNFGHNAAISDRDVRLSKTGTRNMKAIHRGKTGAAALIIALAAGWHCTTASGDTPAQSATDKTPATTNAAANGPEIWKDPTKSPEDRARDLVSRMTLEEKASQIMANTPAIPRLGIPAYSHRNECLHGVANGVATVFPQAIGMASTWDSSLIQQEADAISTEGRAKHNDYVAKHNGDTGEHFGVNFYSPNVNIFRDPRWGRGQETYGEDPFLTGQIGVAFVRGIQGDDPKYLKAVACAKHYAVHSGPEKERHTFDAKPDDRDLYETYLPAFEALVRDGHVHSAMGAYSSLNGVPCCADPFLLTDLLRNTWGFDGVVFSDGGAIGDIWAEHKFVPDPIQGAAVAVKAGCDISSGGMERRPNLNAGPGHANDGIKGGWAFSALPLAVKQGDITEKQVDTAVQRELTMRFRLGLFDPQDMVPFNKIGVDQIDSDEHRALSLKVAQESIVLLKNDGLLPLDRALFKRIAVIGPNADAERMMNGNYTGRNSHSTTILEGIKQLVGNSIDVTYTDGCPLDLKADHSNAPTTQTAAAIDAAKSADLVIFVSGIDSTLEKEEGGIREPVMDGFDRGDRTKIEMPSVQEDLIKQLAAVGKPMVLVNCSGSAIAMPWEAAHVPAIVQAWYPGEEGGQAVAQILFGDVNPAGRLPVTFYSATTDLPDFENYSMANRTYRYFTGKPLFAFGHGLSYTKFDYSNANLDSSTATAADTMKLSFTITNSGARDGDEIAQIYFRHVHSAIPQPQMALCGFTRIHIGKGNASQVSIDIPAQRFRYWDTTQKKYVVEPGDYELMIGTASDDIRLHAPLTIK
jgi:beta-glucosidase